MFKHKHPISIVIGWNRDGLEGIFSKRGVLITGRLQGPRKNLLQACVVVPMEAEVFGVVESTGELCIVDIERLNRYVQDVQDMLFAELRKTFEVQVTLESR